MTIVPSQVGSRPAALDRWRSDPKRQAEAHLANVQRLREAKQRWGYVPIRIGFEVGRAPIKCPKVHGKGIYYKGGHQRLRNTSVNVRVPEPPDVWEFLSDLKRFLVAWRPSRMRSEAGQRAAVDTLAAWERLGSDLRS